MSDLPHNPFRGLQKLFMLIGPGINFGEHRECGWVTSDLRPKFPTRMVNYPQNNQIEILQKLTESAFSNV